MPSKHTSLHLFTKIFIGYTVAIILAVLAIYVTNVEGALSMDPNSYNCLHDSMMRRQCEDPFGSSIGWTMAYVWAYYVMYPWLMWLITLSWIGVGIAAIVQRRKGRASKTK